MKLKTHLKARYARIPRWARRSMGALIGLTLAFFTLLAVAIYVNHKDDGLRREVTIKGFNYTDRPVDFFSVNGVWGGNAFAGRYEGGGGSMCCAVVTIGQSVSLKWTLGATGPQYDTGVRQDDFKVTAIVPPPQSPDAEYLTVHFFKDGRVELGLEEPFGQTRWPAGTDMSKLE